MNESRLRISEDESDHGDSRYETGRARIHAAQRGDPTLIPYRQQTPHPRYTYLELLIRKASTLDTSRTPHPPGPSPTQTADLALNPHTSTHPAHTSHTALIFTRPESTLQIPHSACIHPTHLAHPADSTSIPHTPLSPRTHPARTADSVSAAPARSGAAASAGGAARVRPAGQRRREEEATLSFSDPRFGGGTSSSRGRGRELLATLHGPRSPAPPARSLSPEPRVAGDPKTPASGHAAGLACRSPLPFSPLTASRHLPQRCSGSETHSSAPAADTDSAEAAAGALRS